MPYPTRTVATVAVAGLVALAAAGCGGSSYKAASKSNSTTTASGSGSTDTSTGNSTGSTSGGGGSDAQTLIDAATNGLKSGDLGSSISDTQAHCLGAALVNTIGVDRLKAAGVTAADLSDSSKDLPEAIAAQTPDSVKTQFGAALQACGFAALFGPALAQATGSSGVNVGAKAQKCLTDALNASDSRLVLADAVLRKTPTAADGDVFAGILLGCIDFAPVMAKQFGFALAAAEQTCINAKARTSPELRKVVASGISGGGATSTADQTALGQAIIVCLTPAHIAALGSKGG